VAYLENKNENWLKGHHNISGGLSELDEEMFLRYSSVNRSCAVI
jgi:hypothetical protein